MSLEIKNEESTDSYESAVMVLPSGGPHDYSELNNRFSISPFSETREGTLSVLVTGKNLMPIRYPTQNIAVSVHTHTHTFFSGLNCVLL